MDDDRFRERMAAHERVPHVVLGTTEDGTPYRIPLTDLTSVPSWSTAGTGSGKSRFVGAFMAQIIRALVEGAPVAQVLKDGKGETADFLLRTVAAAVMRMTPARRAAFLSRLYVFRFFGDRFLPSCPLLAPIPGLSADVQAGAIADVLVSVVGDSTLGSRQRAALAAVIALAIEFQIPLAALPWLLSQPGDVVALAARSSVPSVRLSLSRFEREPQGSVDGIVARLDTLLRVPSLKAALSGERAFDFAACSEPGSVSVFDYSGADLGASGSVHAIGSLGLSAYGNSAFDPRRVVQGTTSIVIDELQAFATSIAYKQVERLLTLGRSQGVGGVTLVHQGATQLPTELQSILNTNVALRVLGRSAERDVRAASEWLPRARRTPGQGRAPGTMSEAEQERLWTDRIGHLPTRHFLVADRRTDFAPRIVQALHFDPPPWSAIPPEIADAVLRGAAGVPRADLEARVRDIEERASRGDYGVVLDGGAAPGRRRAPETPDVVGRGGRRGRDDL